MSDEIPAKGVVARAAGEPVQVVDLVLDPPGPGEVLVRMLASGVCHSDLHYKLGTLGNDFPFLLGHEGAGVIESVGAGVDPARVGRFVVLSYRAPCGSCRFCRRGGLQHCAESTEPMAQVRTTDGHILTRALRLGTFATHVVVADTQAVAVSPACPPEQACLLGCGVSTGLGSVLATAGVKAGETVAVFGCGGVGINVVQGARIAHASVIVAVDLDPRKLVWARRFGATHTVDAREADVVNAVRAATPGGTGVNAAFDAVGQSDTLRQALDVLDYKGTAVLIGFPGLDAVLELALQPYFFQGATLRVSLNGDSLPLRDLPLFTDWALQGTLDLEHLVTSRIGLEDVEPAFAAMQRGDTLRSVICFPN